MIHCPHNERGNRHTLDWALLPEKKPVCVLRCDGEEPESGEEERLTGRGSQSRFTLLQLGQKTDLEAEVSEE